MKSIFLIIICSLFSIAISAQTGIKVFFETQKTIKEESLNNLPVHIRATALKQLQSIKEKSYMLIQNNMVYYETIAQNKKVASNGIINTKGSNSNIMFVKDLSMTAISKGIKIVKEYNKNSYTTKVNNKEVTEKLPIVEWKFTKKQKKILGYNCYEASTIYNHKQFTVYFTKELNVFGSPAKFPFIKGVVLEYKYGNSVSCATKVDLNQPTITKFL